MKIYIEHMDDEVYDWSILEYRHISEVFGKKNVTFCHVQNESLKTLGTVYSESVKALSVQNAVLLDPSAPIELSPDDSFSAIIVGGVLGNDPMDGRTAKNLGSMICAKRNLGSMQMSTDTAAIVAKKVLGGILLQDLKFIDNLEIELDDDFSNIFPYRYLVEGDEVVLPKGFVEFLRNQPDNT